LVFPVKESSLRFEDAIKSEVLVFDGAMGTILYEKGISLSHCFDALNLKRPDLVSEVHRAYRESGARILETNTFGANRFRLQADNRADQVAEINREGVRLAREIAGSDLLVAGSMGPLGKHITPIGTIPPEEAAEAYGEQGRALVEAGADLLMLETISDMEEMVVAIRSVRDLGVPVVALMTFNEEAKTVIGNKPQEVARRLTAEGVAALGANCSVGPLGMLEVLEKMIPHSGVPVIAMPNAGLPSLVGGRYLYMSSPEYLADFARKAMDLGAAGVGGCCGTTPEHIRSLVGAAEGRVPLAPGADSPIEILDGDPTHPTAHHEERNDFFSQLGNRFAISVEIDPPRGLSVERFVRSAIYLRSKGADAINVADSPLARPRMSPSAFSHIIQRDAGIEAILHMSCRDRNLLATQSELMGAHALGLRTVIAITGDPVQVGGYAQATGVFDLDSVGLTALITRLNRGEDLAGKSVDENTDFRICVAANPTAVDLAEEVDKLKRKIDAGAHFIFTQPIYDPRDLERFYAMIPDLPIPLCVGVLPLRNARHAEFIHNEVPGMMVPEDIRRRMHGAGEKGMEEGVAIANKFLTEVQPMCAGAYLMPPFNRFEMAGGILEALDSRDVFHAPKVQPA
jgi:methionine synthase I (cobalamin-dependent)/5,10-methylenetetrahydrofolate reductase